jgi:multiple sugar transport system permease protein
LEYQTRNLGWLMLTPAVLYVVVLVGLPFGMALVLAFSDAVTGSLEFTLVGLDNFTRLLQDPGFQRSLRNTLLFTAVSQALVIVLATTLAHILSAGLTGGRAIRLLILLPWAAPIALTTMAWSWIFDSTFSVVNWTLRKTGLLGPGEWLYWLGEPGLAMTAIIIVHVWRTLPFSTVVVLAGLASIPREIGEAAMVDGANFWQRLRYINLPLLLPVVAVSVLFGVVFTATDLSVVHLLTRGGPHNSTHVLSSLAFQQGILGGDLGQGAAIALFLFPLLVVVAITMLRLAASGRRAIEQ